MLLVTAYKHQVFHYAPSPNLPLHKHVISKILTYLIYVRCRWSHSLNSFPFQKYSSRLFGLLDFTRMIKVVIIEMSATHTVALLF